MAIDHDCRNIPLLQEIGVAEFNGGDANSAAMLFSGVRPSAAYTLLRGSQTD